LGTDADLYKEWGSRADNAPAVEVVVKGLRDNAIVGGVVWRCRLAMSFGGVVEGRHHEGPLHQDKRTSRRDNDISERGRYRYGTMAIPLSYKGIPRDGRVKSLDLNVLWI